MKLKFSSSDPNVSGVAPELKTYFLNYNTIPPTYKRTSNNLNGKVTNSKGEPLPGTTIVVQGTTNGTVTDMEGNYSITIPNNTSRVNVNYIGYNPKTLPITGRVMNVILEENTMALNEVVTIGYGVQKNLCLQEGYRGWFQGCPLTNPR